jgi:hypothetical protein|nr:MAG: hypothetical protein DIU62_09830 [Pseudomonadota bacterium]
MRPVIVLALACMATSLVGCGRGTSTAPAPATASSPPIQEVMANAFTPQSNQLWEISGKVYDDEGNISAAMLSEEDWAALVKVATEMRAAATGLKDTANLQVAAPGVKLQGEEGPGALSATQIKALIDALPQEFAAEADRLIEVADGVLAAVQARDAEKLDELSGVLNEVCTSCHTKFWYPEQEAAE